MARSIGWRREGSKGRFRYVDADGRRITDEEQLERIRALAIPPAWKDVWISPGPRAKLQATGYDAAGRKQYLYHADYRARQEQAKYDKLIRFAERLPALREVLSEHIQLDGLPEEKVAAIAVRLINLGWFRVGSDRVREGVTHVRDHDAAQAPCRRSRLAHLVSLSRQAQHHDPQRDRRSRARRGDEGAAGGAGEPALQVRSRGPTLQPRQPAPQRLHPGRSSEPSSRPRTSGPGAARWSPRSRSPSRNRRRPTPTPGAGSRP